MSNFITLRDEDERKAEILARRAARSNPEAVAQRAAERAAAEAARKAAAQREQEQRHLMALEHLAGKASPSAVQAVIDEIETGMLETMCDFPEVSECDAGSEVTLAVVSRMLSSRKTAVKYGIAAEVLRTQRGWSTEEIHEWLIKGGF